MAREKLRAAQRVADRGVENIAERLREEDVADAVEKTHRVAFHRIDEAAAVDEIREASHPGFIKLDEQLGRHRQIGIEDRQQIAGRVRESHPHSVVLASPGLLQRLDRESITPCRGDAASADAASATVRINRRITTYKRHVRPIGSGLRSRRPVTP